MVKMPTSANLPVPHIMVHWSGGFESCHKITRTVVRFDQLETYPDLLDRALGLALDGKR
jgi:hypothetical protein